MALAKLKVLMETSPGTFGKEVEVLYNPNKVTLTKAAKWSLVPTAERDAPTSQFTYGEPATLALELFFDTYESGKDVQTHTREILHLTTVEKHGELHRPPLCKLAWGLYSFDGYQWVVTNLVQAFTLFRSDGTPARATLTCSFRQWRSDEVEQKLLNKQSPDVAKTRIVQRGETLSSIAAAEYNDPALWRPIAEANGIDNPRLLEPGRPLSIPVLDPASISRG
jgi:nucleoid-associated protein YgaU